MASKEILKEALASYTGTLLIVSHDRDFLDGLTDRVYFIKDKDVKVYYEPVSQFIESYYGAAAVTEQKQVVKKQPKKTNNKKSQNKQKSLERKITQLEEKQADLEFQMYQTNDQEKIIELQKQLKNVKTEMDASFEALMSLSE